MIWMGGDGAEQIKAALKALRDHLDPETRINVEGWLHRCEAHSDLKELPIETVGTLHSALYECLKKSCDNSPQIRNKICLAMACLFMYCPVEKWSNGELIKWIKEEAKEKEALAPCLLQLLICIAKETSFYKRCHSQISLQFEKSMRESAGTVLIFLEDLISRKDLKKQVLLTIEAWLPLCDRLPSNELMKHPLAYLALTSVIEDNIYAKVSEHPQRSLKEDTHVSNKMLEVGPSPTPPQPLPVEWPEDGRLTRDWVSGLTSTLNWCSHHLPADQLPTLLPAPVVEQLVSTAASEFHKEPNLVRINPRPSQSIVVVGDVHGQLHDMIFLLHDAGFPSEERLFVFNGDYVDRGAWGVETFLLLLAWKVLLPNCVFLLRGNHESQYCTSAYGFEEEVKTKYNDQGHRVYRKFLSCFKDLPLATIIAGCVYTAHGGIFREIISLPSKRAKKGKKGRKYKANSTVDLTYIKLGSLDELLKARRNVLDPPWEGQNLIPGDVLWSDPSLELGLSLNVERGLGLLWGPDITQQFLCTNNLKLIIRSHEGPDARDKRHDLLGMDKGYTIDHDVECGKLITLFSAPDYPQFQASEDRYNNCGAYIVLNSPDYSTPVFHSFDAVKPRPAARAYYKFEEALDSDEELDFDAMDSSSTASR